MVAPPPADVATAFSRVKDVMREKCWGTRNAWAYDRYRLLSRQEGWRRLLERELAAIPRGARILEVGSGTGFITEILIHAGFRVQGLDLSDEMLARARRNLATAGIAHMAELAQGDAEEIAAPDGQFPAVVSRWVLWTLPRPHKALAEMARVLVPGGKLVLIDGRHRNRGAFAGFRARLTDLVLCRRLPGWQKQSYGTINSSLPFLDAPEVVETLRESGLTQVSFRRLSPSEGDGRLNNWLMGDAWESCLVTGVKPALGQ
jgi:ubiquinone/menaquinone biosynthesis C-methylase UbiE